MGARCRAALEAGIFFVTRGDRLLGIGLAFLGLSLTPMILSPSLGAGVFGGLGLLASAVIIGASQVRSPKASGL